MCCARSSPLKFYDSLHKFARFCTRHTSRKWIVDSHNSFPFFAWFVSFDRSSLRYYAPIKADPQNVLLFQFSLSPTPHSVTKVALNCFFTINSRQLNATIIICRSLPTSQDVLVALLVQNSTCERWREMGCNAMVLAPTGSLKYTATIPQLL